MLHKSRKAVFAAVCTLATFGIVLRAQEPNLTDEQKHDFLMNAKVVGSKHTGKGVTSPWKLTLSDGTVTHDAAFQTVDEHKTNMQFASGQTEMLFVDSYKYDIAAYQVAKLLGLADMMPVTVERKWEGKSGALSWWLPTMPGMMDEGERLKQKKDPPDPEAWNRQMWKKRIFAQLVYDTDPNLTNLLISPDWKVYMIDFTRAFRLYNKLENAKNLTKCDKQLFANLQKLDQSQLEEATKRYLNKSEVKAVMQRRDLIVDYFKKLAAEKGDAEVFY